MAGGIVLGYDGQSGSVAALRTATEMAAAFGCPLIVVFGHRPAAIGGDVSDLGKAVRGIGEQLMAEAVDAARAIDASVTVETEVIVLRPADAVLGAGDQHDARAIVVGTTGQGPIKGALLGSVTYQVVHRATRPVVVVPAPEEDES
jgi:nucleotide-binding universal stress UspA family protein